MSYDHKEEMIAEEKDEEILRLKSINKELVEALTFCMLACSRNCPPEFNLNAAYQQAKQALSKTILNQGTINKRK